MIISNGGSVQIEISKIVMGSLESVGTGLLKSLEKTGVTDKFKDLSKITLLRSAAIIERVFKS